MHFGGEDPSYKDTYGQVSILTRWRVNAEIYIHHIKEFSMVGSSRGACRCEIADGSLNRSLTHPPDCSRVPHALQDAVIATESASLDSLFITYGGIPLIYVIKLSIAVIGVSSNFTLTVPPPLGHNDGSVDLLLVGGGSRKSAYARAA